MILNETNGVFDTYLSLIYLLVILDILRADIVSPGSFFPLLIISRLLLSSRLLILSIILVISLLFKIILVILSFESINI
jgi:hypothetical protein